MTSTRIAKTDQMNVIVVSIYHIMLGFFPHLNPFKDHVCSREFYMDFKVNNSREFNLEFVNYYQ